LERFAVEPRARLAHNHPMESTPATKLPANTRVVAVIMERVTLANRWATERWEAKGVVPHASDSELSERIIVEERGLTQILFPGLTLRLQRDEAEGYYLNITSPQPKVFVLWRMRDGMARPEQLSVSYHEGARWMDAEETVDGVALPPEFMPWMADFAAEHYKPEPRKKVRYASSKDMGVASRRGGAR
jgi:hypothetical protein